MTNPLAPPYPDPELALLMLSDIEPDAFLRERSRMDEEGPRARLMGSILAHGIRQPVGGSTETGTPTPLRADLRPPRLEASAARLTKIPALIPPSADPRGRFLAAIVEENEVRG